MYFTLLVVNISRICVLVVSSNDESEGKYTSVITPDHTADKLKVSNLPNEYQRAFYQMSISSSIHTSTEG
jgi:hypothetical protein